MLKEHLLFGLKKLIRNRDVFGSYETKILRCLCNRKFLFLPEQWNFLEFLDNYFKEFSTPLSNKQNSRNCENETNCLKFKCHGLLIRVEWHFSLSNDSKMMRVCRKTNYNDQVRRSTRAKGAVPLLPLKSRDKESKSAPLILSTDRNLSTLEKVVAKI